MQPEEKKLYGVLGECDGPAGLLKAAATVRDAGFRHFDCHSPFPVHGMDKAMGLRKSILGWIVFACGATGAIGGLAMQWWMSAVDYKLVISGKPFFSHQAFIPITFECTILLSAFGAVFGMFALNRLPMLWHHLFNSASFKRVSDSGFFVSIDATDPKFDLATCKKLLQSAGCKEIEVIE